MKVEQGVLRERVRSMPDHDALREKFREMEEQLDKKFDHLFKQFQEAFALATTKFRCPHDTDRPGAATDLG